MRTLIVFMLAFAALAATNQPPPVQGPAELPLKVLVASTVFPSIQMDAVELQKVMEWLRAESKKYTPDKAEINFVWQIPADAKVRPVTLNLKKVPLNDVLDYVTQAAGLRYRVERHAVVIYLPEPPPVKKPASDAKPQ